MIADQGFSFPWDRYAPFIDSINCHSTSKQVKPVGFRFLWQFNMIFFDFNRFRLLIYENHRDIDKNAIINVTDHFENFRRFLFLSDERATRTRFDNRSSNDDNDEIDLCRVVQREKESISSFLHTFLFERKEAMKENWFCDFGIFLLSFRSLFNTDKERRNSSRKVCTFQKRRVAASSNSVE